MGKEDEQPLWRKILKGLQGDASGGRSSQKKEQRPRQTRREIQEQRLAEIKRKFDEKAKEQYQKSYDQLTAEEKIKVLSGVLPKDSSNEAVKKTQEQIEELRKKLQIPEDDDAQKKEERRPWTWENRRRYRDAGKKFVEDQEELQKRRESKQTRDDGDGDQSKEEEEEVRMIIEEIEDVLFAESERELTGEIIARSIAVDLEIKKIIKDRNLGEEEAFEKFKELYLLVSEETEARKDEYYEQLLLKYKDSVQKEMNQIGDDQINEMINFVKQKYGEKYRKLEDDFQLYAREARRFQERQEDFSDDKQTQNNRYGDIERFRIPEGASEEEKERILQDVFSYLDSYIDLIEERSEFSHELQFDTNYQELRRKIAEIKLFAFPNNPDLRARLEERMNMLFALHDINLGLTKPPFDREKIGVIQRSAPDLHLGEIYNEMTRSIHGVDGVIGKTAHYAEQALLELIHKKPNHRFEQSDAEILSEKIRNFVDELYEGNTNIDDQTKERIARRAERFFTASLRKALIIARKSQLPDDSTRFENDPMGPIITLFRPSYFIHEKWGTISEKEKEVLSIIFGTFGEIDEIMGDFNDPYSSGFRMDSYINALEQAGYQHAGLWMRIRQSLPLRRSNESDEDYKKRCDLIYKRRSDAFDHLLTQDTHMLPLLSLYQDDAGLTRILSDGGFQSFSDFETTLSKALYMKLQNMLKNPNMAYDPTLMNPRHIDLLNQHANTIHNLLSFLERKKHDIKEKLGLEFEPSHDHHGKSSKKKYYHDRPNYLWKKTISTADIPMHILASSKSLVGQSDYWSRIYTGDLGAVYGIREQLNHFIRHPQDLSKLAEVIASLEAQGGRGGAQERFRKMMEAIIELNRPTWYAQWLPEWMIDLIPGLYASKLQKIRGKSFRAWGLPQRMEIMHRLEQKGIITPENEHFYKEILKVRLIDRMIPTIQFALLLSSSAILLIVITQAIKELEGSSEG